MCYDSQIKNVVISGNRLLFVKEMKCAIFRMTLRDYTYVNVLAYVAYKYINAIKFLVIGSIVSK
jgi:hypothetical protein